MCVEKESGTVGSTVGEERGGRCRSRAQIDKIVSKATVPWVPWINHHIQLHCHVGAAGAEVLPSFMTPLPPPTHTHTLGHFATSCIVQ